MFNHFDNIILTLITLIVEHKNIFVFRESISPDVECCPVGDIINILQAAFAPIFFCQKNNKAKL